MYFSQLRKAFEEYNLYRVGKGLDPILEQDFGSYALKCGYGTWETFMDMVKFGLYNDILNNEYKIKQGQN